MARDVAAAKAPGSTWSERYGGYTLLEILVSMGILVLLGAGLVTLLSQGIQLWNRAETQGRLHEKARLLLERIASDLRSVVGRAHGGADTAWVRFLCDLDPAGRQRLRLVRSIAGEMSDTLLREGGRLLSVSTPAAYDGHNDAWEARKGLLGAPGGLMEVVYAMDPRPGTYELLRGVRSPIGGIGSLFIDENLAAAGETPGRAQGSTAVDRQPYRAAARPLTAGILYLGFSFWGATTNTWDPSVPTLLDPKPGQRSGPLLSWDSTRAVLDTRGRPGELHFERREGSLLDPSDDVFPGQVEVTLVLHDEPSSRSLVLSEKVGDGQTKLLLSRPISLADDARERFVLVEEEWIAVDAVSGREIESAQRGRGARDTRAVAHEAGSPVALGATFRRVVSIPGRRRSLSEGDTAAATTRSRR